MIEYLCAIAFIARVAAFCGPQDGPVFAGYVEGEYAQIAPVVAARIRAVHVERGDRIEAGAPIADLEDDDAVLAVRTAQARVAEARARLLDLRSGRRPEEIAAIEAALRSAQAQEKQAEANFERQKALYSRGHASKAQLDHAEAERDVATARIAEIKARLAVARLPARHDEIVAARERLNQAEAALETARWQLAQRDLAAPSDGRVFDILRRPGEIAGPNAAVVSFLPAGAIRLRFYVPQTFIAEIAVGDEVTVECDGCPDDLKGRVSYVAPEPEFTPPVIYSIETRQKLVYMVEARPPPGDERLRPGQIVDVRKAAAATGTTGAAGAAR